MKLRILYPTLLALLFISCSRSFVKQQEFKHYSLKEVSNNAAADSLIAPYKNKIDAETGKVIAVSDAELTKSGDQTTLGNFVCDALQYAVVMDLKDSCSVTLVNRGGLRANLPKGNITIQHIFELMPFDNELVLVSVSGKKLMEGALTLAKQKHPFGGLMLKYSNGTITKALVKGQPIDPERTYVVATSDFLANGGDNVDFLKSPLAVKSSGLKIRDAIIHYCIYLNTSGKHISPYTDERLEISK